MNRTRTEVGRFYERFPYPLEAVEAYVRFDRGQVLVEYLNGRGAGGAPQSC